MLLKIFCSMTLFVFMLVSCGDAITTKSKPKSDKDVVSTVDDDSVSVNDDSTHNDDSTQNDNEVKTDDDSTLSDEDIPEGCGNGTVEGFEVCDGGTMDCVNLNSSLYSGGKAKCKADCSGWDTATCETTGQDECTAGTKQCYGAYQYQACDDFDDDGYTEWGEAQTCSNSGTCSGNGICSNDCYAHNYYECYNGNVYWYDSCGTREEQKESCGVSGYVGSKYCSDSYIYQDYKTVSCNSGYDSCSESTDAVYIETCSNGCTSGACNSAKDAVWYDSSSALYWQNSSFTTGSTQSTASSYCSNLSLGGYSDWRLPTISELRSLVRGCSNTITSGTCNVSDSCTTYSSCYTGCSACTSGSGPSDAGMYWDAALVDTGSLFWSNTILSDYTTYGYSIDFTTGGLGYNYTTTTYDVRCVRGTMSGVTLTAPANVAASDGSYSGYVYVSWSAVSNATDYYIYRSTSSTGTYSYVGDSGGASYTYYYDYPPSTSTYYYKVSAYSSTYGEGAMSAYNSGYCY